MDCSTPGFPVHHQLLELAQTHVHWVSDVIQPSHPLSSILLLPSIFPSIRVFSNESALCIRWPKYWRFSFSISPSSEYSQFISFRIDWLDLLAVQGTLKSLHQHHSSKASVLWCSAFFMVQLSHPYMNTGKSVQSFSRVWLYATLQTAASQASLSIANSSSLLKLLSIESVISSNHLILKSPSPLAFSLSQHHGLFQGVNSSHQVSKVLELQLQHQSFQWILRSDLFKDGLIGSRCSPRDSQESSLTPDFKSINSLVLSFFCIPTLTSIHDYWKKHSLD